MLVKMNQTNGVEVKVGIVTPKMHYRKGRSAIPIAQVYQWVDEGTGSKKAPDIPPRPTLIPTFDKYNKLLSEWFADDLIRNATLPQGNMSKPLQRVGSEFAKLVKAEIMNLSSPKLRPYTIRNRVNKGRYFTGYLNHLLIRCAS